MLLCSLVAFEPTCAELLLVSLHLGHRAGDGIVRALPVLPPRPALAQQVPALVQRLFSKTKPLPLLFRAQLALRELVPELVLRFDQLADPRHDVLVVHVLKVCRKLSGVRSGPVLAVRTDSCFTPVPTYY